MWCCTMVAGGTRVEIEKNPFSPIAISKSNLPYRDAVRLLKRRGKYHVQHPELFGGRQGDVNISMSQLSRMLPSLV